MDWEKVSKCKHKNLYNYGHWSLCSTLYCGSEFEYHCRDCNVFFNECDCGVENGMSGWSYRRWKAFDKKKEEKENVYLGNISNRLDN